MSEKVVHKRNANGVRNSVKLSADKTKKKRQNKKKKEHFLWIKMWVNYVISMTMKDRGQIPDNIGSRILITNNLYITKLFLTTIVQIVELGQNTPITLMEILTDELRKRGNKAILDLTCKNTNYEFNLDNSGLQARIKAWENTVEKGLSTRRMRERSARCLYTVEIGKSGVQLKHSRMFLSIRAKDIDTLNNAERIIYQQLGTMGCLYLPSYATVRRNLEYISIIGNRNTDLKAITPAMMTNVTLSQLVANAGSYNDTKGYYLGQNILNGSPYYLDTSKITVARNMYCVAPSGVGKTVLALNMAQSAFEQGSACCFMDIKGNEYTTFINATGGYIISLRPMSIEYINSFIMHKSDVKYTDDPSMYFKERVQFSKTQMVILSGLRNREEVLELEELLDEFLEAMYISIGAIPTNINSWQVTELLDPFVVFEKFEAYLTPQKRQQYNIKQSTIGTLRMYYTRHGSKCYVFQHEFDYAKILRSQTISFDFGLLGNMSITDIDEDLFRLKFLYMSRLNGEFTRAKYTEGRRTFKILEESQIVSDDIMKMYVQEYTLRRSQSQDTLLLGNSVQALSDNAIAKPIIENTLGLFVGELTKDAREVVIEQFGLRDMEGYLKLPGSSTRFKNSFVFINNMQDKELYPVIQVMIERDEDNKPVKYKVNTPVREDISMAGISNDE